MCRCKAMWQQREIHGARRAFRSSFLLCCHKNSYDSELFNTQPPFSTAQKGAQVMELAVRQSVLRVYHWPWCNPSGPHVWTWDIEKEEEKIPAVLEQEQLATTVFHSTHKRLLILKRKWGLKKKEPIKTFKPSFVPVLNGKIFTLFSAVVAKSNHSQPLTLLNHRLPPCRVLLRTNACGWPRNPSHLNLAKGHTKSFRASEPPRDCWCVSCHAVLLCQGVPRDLSPQLRHAAPQTHPNGCPHSLGSVLSEAQNCSIIEWLGWDGTSPAHCWSWELSELPLDLLPPFPDCMPCPVAASIASLWMTYLIPQEMIFTQQLLLSDICI